MLPEGKLEVGVFNFHEHKNKTKSVFRLVSVEEESIQEYWVSDLSARSFEFQPNKEEIPEWERTIFSKS